jgi:hypothetical protein
MSKGITPFPTWLSQEAYEQLPLGERALLHARAEYDRFRDVPTMETLGTNRGERIDQYARDLGLPLGGPWCARFVLWAFVQAGWKRPPLFTNPDSSCNWLVEVPAGKYGVKDVGRLLKEPKRGCIAGWCKALWTPKGPWQGHVFFVAEVIKLGGRPVAVRTIEGNSNESGSREGNRIVMKTRPLTQRIRSVEIFEY